MKKKLIITALLNSLIISAQVGINTTSPKSTMDVSVKRDLNGVIIDNSTPVGLQAPRITREELSANTGVYNTNQTGAIVYIKDVNGGDTNPPRTNIISVGYYYFDGTLWQKMSGGSNDVNIYKDNGVLTSQRTVSLNGNNLAFTDNGNIGIGTTSPSKKLEIQTGGTQSSPLPGLKLVDGNQLNNLVLTSDNDGVATWKPVGIKIVKGVINDNTGAGDYYFQSNPAWISTHSYINLPPGNWRVDVTQLLRYNAIPLDVGDYMWMRFTFGDSDTATTLTNDLQGTSRFISGNIFGPSNGGTKYGVAQGSVFITNSSSSSKKYYLLTGSSTSSITNQNKFISTVGSNNWGENIITAFPVTD